MEFHEIRYFLAVCQTLNFTRAAEQCNVTQPALTRAIQKIEGELGGLLFSRERGNTHLTELGRLMQPHLEEIMARTRAAKEQAARFLSLESAHLRLGVMCTIGPLRFVGFLNRFRADHPGVELTLTESVPDRLSEALLQGELDVAVMARPDGFDERLRAEPLYAERFAVACAVGHPFARRNAVTMTDMDGQTYLQRINCEYRDLLREQCEARGARILRSYRSEREDWIQTMVAAGMGVCFLPEFSATHPGVVTRLVQDPEVMRTVSLVTVAGRRWSPPLASFIRAIHAYRWPAPAEHQAAGLLLPEDAATAGG
ncbi:LysR family transcriptional regulator [Paracraurococcus ruber]|uniref:Transcriptional regulator n=1 Tax=Paracraurococcus ruber TaxID=77675 RepID=A0ABS1CZU8_9PROT|nr:LysR family transcriptional regulator [Paracraurococcus ruber]MBK1659923.1 transcriptional regulator [Paracraurococcus ruber]TDG27368.1 LysR family transcriptional regulator [Paracraurococcus ruber]